MVGDNINIMKTTFELNFYSAFKQHGYTKIWKKRKAVNLNSFTLITCYLVLRKKLVNNKNLNKKSSTLYWYYRLPPYFKNPMKIKTNSTLVQVRKNSDKVLNILNLSIFIQWFKKNSLKIVIIYNIVLNKNFLSLYCSNMHII